MGERQGRAGELGGGVQVPLSRELTQQGDGKQETRAGSPREIRISQSQANLSFNTSSTLYTIAVPI